MASSSSPDTAPPTASATTATSISAPPPESTPSEQHRPQQRQQQSQQAPLSNLIRLAPLPVGEIPPHPDLPQPDEVVANPRSSISPAEQPELLPFLLTLLDDGLQFLSPSVFNTNFKHHSNKSAPPSKSDVEVLTYSIPSTTLSNVPWFSATSTTTTAAPAVSRTRPRTIPTEHWFARRSFHANVSSKTADADQKGSASWAEFVYGLRDNHSAHEKDFTPTIYAAYKVVDWNSVIYKLEAEGGLVRRGGSHEPQYDNVTLGIYEMCHAIPAPMTPRCFPVLVATANVALPAGRTSNTQNGTAKKKFIAVTVPVTLGSTVKNALFSNNRNLTFGEDPQSRKEVVLGAYTAVETVQIQDDDQIEWLMATASDAKGNLPMWSQKMALPGALPKDVSYFMKWIPTVDDVLIESVNE